MTEKEKKTPSCPICKASAGRRADNRFFPFCSDRCRMIDLGRWLGEEYAVSETVRPLPGPGKDDLM